MHRMAGGGWMSLPADLLKEVSDRLPADADKIHVRQLCSHWRASTAPLAARRPWVVAANDRHRDPFSVVNPVGEHSLWPLRGGGARIEIDSRPRPASPTAAARPAAGSCSRTTCDPPRGSSSWSPSPKPRSLCPP
ncbi:hypothetical protein D1007_11444 [Hordeum vulgare]|nr:hypothetical protein D1007_11444 [Hordeum vulgare]